MASLSRAPQHCDYERPKLNKEDYGSFAFDLTNTDLGLLGLDWSPTQGSYLGWQT